MDKNSFLKSLEELRRTQSEHSHSLFQSSGCVRCSDCRFCEACSDCYDCNYASRSVSCAGCTEISDSERCSESSHLERCFDCHHSNYLTDCRGCSECNYCFGCVGLLRTEFAILNVVYKRKEWFAKVKELRKILGL